MTIYEFILKYSKYGKELFESKEIILKMRRMTDEDKTKFLKSYDEKRKPKKKNRIRVRKKVDNKKEKAYNNKTNGEKNEAKSVSDKRKRKTASKSTSDWCWDGLVLLSRK